MTALRLMEGIDLESVSERFGEEEASRLVNEAKPHIATKKIEIDKGFIRLSEEGRLFADGIASDLFA